MSAGTACVDGERLRVVASLPVLFPPQSLGNGDMSSRIRETKRVIAHGGGTRGGQARSGGHFPVFDQLFKKGDRDLSMFCF
jgi:hypothetical protein